MRVGGEHERNLAERQLAAVGQTAAKLKTFSLSKDGKYGFDGRLRKSQLCDTMRKNSFACVRGPARPTVSHPNPAARARAGGLRRV